MADDKMMRFPKGYQRFKREAEAAGYGKPNKPLSAFVLKLLDHYLETKDFRSLLDRLDLRVDRMNTMSLDTIREGVKKEIERERPMIRRIVREVLEEFEATVDA